MSDTVNRFLLSSLVVVALPSCDDGDPAPPAEGEGEGPAGDRVCPEVYVCVVECRAQGSRAPEGCIDDCAAAAHADSTAAVDGLMACVEETCKDEAADAWATCMFEDCAAGMTPCTDDAREVRNPCDDGTPNEQGIGTSCSAAGECAGEAGATNCAWAEVPGKDMTDEEREAANLSRWCSHLCEEDAGCGADAFCWVRAGYSSPIVSSCALTSCLVP